MSLLRVAVIGVGHLGQHHARLLSGMEDVELVGVVDTKPGRAAEIAAQYGTRAFTDARDVRTMVDAVTASHLEVKARIPGADKAKFDEAANAAKSGCPISKLLNAKITMNASLES